MDHDLCDKATCIGCVRLPACPIFRAQYERKKSMIQEKRYSAELEQAEIIESKELSFHDLVEAAYSLKEYYLKGNKIHTVLLKLALRKHLGIRIGLNKAYEVKASLLQDYPEDFDIAS